MTLDDQTYFYDLIVEPLRDASDELIGVTGASLDITERKRQEADIQYHAHLLANVHDAIVATDEKLILTVWNPAAEVLYGWKAKEVLGRSVTEVLDAGLDEAQRAEAYRTLAETGYIRGEYTHPHKDGHPVHIEGVTITLRHENGQISGYASVNRDISERLRVEAVLRRHTNQIEAIADLSHTLASVAMETKAVAAIVVERIAKLVGDACVLRLRSNNEQLFEITAYHHPDPQTKAVLGKVLSAGSWNRALEQSISGTGQPLLIPNITQEHIDAFLKPEHDPYLEEYGFHSLLIVPMRLRGKIIGIVSVSRDSAGHPYSNDDQNFLQELADRAALAFENARLFEEVNRGREQMQQLARQVISAQEEERRRIARELHDEAGQSLTALKASLQMVRAAIPSEFDALRQSLGQDIELADMTLEHIRLLAHNLRPPILDMVELVAVLESYCHEFARRTQLAVDFEGANLPPLPDDIEILLYRFLQEALTNIAKHAQASRVFVKLDYTEEAITLRVEDDGQGFEPEFASHLPFKGIGLTGIRERLMPIGGWLEIHSTPGQGSSLTVYVPFVAS